MNWMRRLFFAAVPGLLAAGSHGAEPPLTSDQIKSAVRVESVTIPMPGEFFAAIDKAGRPGWTQLIRTGTPPPTTDRAQIALILGTLVADGYIAVEAQDAQAVKSTGKEIINLAKKLNVSQSVLGRGNSINDFAENNDWNALREELEATQNEVKLSMAEQKDQNLIALVTLGAWVRGTDIASGLVDGTYTPETAQLLHQPAIIEYLISEVDSLPKGLTSDPLVADLRAGLGKSLGLVKAPTPSEQEIKELHQNMSAMTTEIVQGPKQ